MSDLDKRKKISTDDQLSKDDSSEIKSPLLNHVWKFWQRIYEKWLCVRVSVD